MGILEFLIGVFLAIFVLGLVLSVAIWLIWLALILAVIFFVVRLVRKIFKFGKKL